MVVTNLQLGLEDAGWELEGGGLEGMTEWVVPKVTSGPFEKLWEDAMWWDVQVWK